MRTFYYSERSARLRIFFFVVVFGNITLPRNKLKGPNPLFNSSFYLPYDSELRASKDVVEKVFNLFTCTYVLVTKQLRQTRSLRIRHKRCAPYIMIVSKRIQYTDKRRIKNGKIISKAYVSSTCVHMSRSSEAVPSRRIWIKFS